MLANLRISARLTILTAITFLLLVAVATLGFNGMGSMEARMKSMYEDRVVCLGQISAMLNGLQRIRTRMMWVIEAEDGTKRDAHLAAIADYDATIDKQLKDYMATVLTPEETVLVNRFTAALATNRADRSTMLAILKSGDAATAKSMLSPEHDMAKRWVATTDILTDLIKLQIRVSAEEFAAAEATYDSTRAASLAVILLGLVAAGIITLVIVRSITVPVAAAIGIMDRLAKDDTSVEVAGLERRDEVGDIARSVQVFKQNAIDKKRMETEAAGITKRAEESHRADMNRLASDFEADIGKVADGVTAASTEMEHTAQTMSALAGQVAAQASAVAAASGQAAANVETVAAATEELSSSVSEIGRQVSESARVARAAVEEATETDAIVRGLAAAAGRIGEVVNLINDIAGQTNLLALNATIEAARAGEAGKGFAVVAGEVKGLANQTAKATGDIAGQINAVQAETNRAVAAIRHVGGTIGRINEISTAIASAVEQQSAATQEIARNIEQASRGTQEVSSNIAGVTQAASETGAASASVLQAARKLSAESGSLNTSVGAFVAKVRAG